MFLWNQLTYYSIVVLFFALLSYLGLPIFFFLLMICCGALWWYHIPSLPGHLAAPILGGTLPKEKENVKPMIIAHRGGALDAPENTIEAFQLAKKNGADAVEFDVEITSDGCPVLMHDDTLDRTTDGTGFVRDHAYEQISKLNAAAKYKNRELYPYVKVPSLDEAVRKCLELKLKMFIDCKKSSAQTIVVLRQLFDKYPALYKEAVVCSFFPNVIYRVRQADPKIVTALIHRHQFITKVEMDAEDRWTPVWQRIASRVGDVILEVAHYVFLWYLCGTSGFLMNRDSYSGIFHTFWLKRGLRVVVWTVNDAYEKEYLLKSRGCSVITDTLL